ncbi:MAG: hypothetical protein R8K48_04820 [Gallionella sp.]
MKSIWILHEGNAKKTHDNALICLLIEHLSKTNSEVCVDKVEFHGMGKKSNFFDPGSYPKQLTGGVDTDSIRKVLLVVDADDANNDARYGGVENTQRALKDLLEGLKLGDVKTYIMCDPTTQIGYLESLILSTITEKQKNCIQSFLDCSEFKSKENHKAILNSIYKMAYPRTPYNFSHSNFDELKNVLRALFSSE